MSEAEILQMIGNMDSLLTRNTRNANKNTIVMVINELRLILDFIADKKLEEGSTLKFLICDVVEMTHVAHINIHNNPPDCYNTQGAHIANALRATRKIILQLGVDGGNKCPITSSSPPQELEENVVGLEQDVETLLHKLLLIEVVCITGMAGVGKTTLAMKLYNHASVVDQYDLRVWICASDEPSNREVLMKLILQVTDYKDQSVLLEETKNADNGSLKRILMKHLQNKTFLIVLDNIGKIPYIDTLLHALIFQADKKSELKKSRLLLTSRFLSVSHQLRQYLELYSPRSIDYRIGHYLSPWSLEMKPLDDIRSWQLFLKLLISGNQQFPKQLEEKGKEMLRNCAGLPLSIKEVATQFVIKRQSGSKWEELLKSPDLSVTLAVLESVYNRWTPNLKSCFLCLSFFKKGTPIRREKLVQVWIAGQVIPEEDDSSDDRYDPHFKLYWDFLRGYKATMMKLLDEYVIEVDLNKRECIKCIRVNASFLTLSMIKVEEEMLFETIKKGKSNILSAQEPRHRVIYCGRDEFNHSTDHDERLVSLFFRGGGYFDSSEPYWKRFQHLRTLDFEGFGLKILPETIGALTELRYLGLRDNYIQKLPESLGCLKNLELLDIALNFGVEVPDIIWEISSLRHLYMSDIICTKPLKIDILVNLETFTYISVDNWAYEVSSLKLMTRLRKLGIEVDENSDVSKLFASLANFSKLDCLILKGSRFRSMPSLDGLQSLYHLKEIRLDGLITKLPSLPRDITHLSLINSCLDEDPMPELSTLRCIEYLKLKNAYTGQQMMVPRHGFRRPFALYLEELLHVRTIQFREDSTFLITKLEIKSCPYLEINLKNLLMDGYGFRRYLTELTILTTKKIAAKNRKSDCMSGIKRDINVDIQP